MPRVARIAPAGMIFQVLNRGSHRRRHEHRDVAGRGHLYQGMYKSFPIQEDADEIRDCIVRGRAYGDLLWQQNTPQLLGFGFIFRPRGRPRTR